MVSLEKRTIWFSQIEENYSTGSRKFKYTDMQKKLIEDAIRPLDDEQFEAVVAVLLGKLRSAPLASHFIEVAQKLQSQRRMVPRGTIEPQPTAHRAPCSICHDFSHVWVASTRFGAMVETWMACSCPMGETKAIPRYSSNGDGIALLPFPMQFFTTAAARAEVPGSLELAKNYWAQKPAENQEVPF